MQLSQTRQFDCSEANPPLWVFLVRIMFLTICIGWFLANISFIHTNQSVRIFPSIRVFIIILHKQEQFCAWIGYAGLNLLATVQLGLVTQTGTSWINRTNVQFLQNSSHIKCSGKMSFNFKPAQTIPKFPWQSFHWYHLIDFKIPQVSEWKGLSTTHELHPLSDVT